MEEDTLLKEAQNIPAPTLVFDEGIPAAPELPVVSKEAENGSIVGSIDDSLLSDEEKRQVDEFSKKIDIQSTAAVIQFGAGAQQKMAQFSEKTLDSVRSKDLGEVGEQLSGLVTQLKSFEIDENEHGIKAFFKKSANKAEGLKARYAKVEANVETVAKELDRHQVTLLKDVENLDHLYELNLAYYKEITMYILAGKKKLEEVRSGQLLELQKKAEETGQPHDAQAAKDLAAQCDRFEKKLYDLELSRTIAMQTAPQIRMVQSSDTERAEKIQSTIVNTIPLWKNQMVIALGIEHTAQAAKAQREVTDMTNELLRKNADKLHTATVEAAKENERGIVDIETLKHTNETLISTLDEVVQIQQDGRARRAEAEKQLVDMENQLKQKLLEASRK